MFTWLDQNWPNWKITLAALFTAVCIAVQDSYVSGTLHKTTILIVVGMAVVGFFAKGRSVTGGSIPQTREASGRVEKMGTQSHHIHRVGALILGVLLLAGVNGCAIKHKQNPALPEATVTELNFANQLQLLEGDYRNFFTDVGAAHRSGLLNATDVAALNAIGSKLKLTIEHGNRAFKEWQANKADDNLKAIVQAAIQEGTGLFLDLVSQREAALRTHQRR